MCKRLREIKNEILDSNAVKMMVFYNDPYTFVRLTYGTLAGEGFSKRNPIDKPNQERGFEIAYGRALHKIALQLIQRGRKCKSS